MHSRSIANTTSDRKQPPTLQQRWQPSNKKQNHKNEKTRLLLHAKEICFVSGLCMGMCLVHRLDFFAQLSAANYEYSYKMLKSVWRVSTLWKLCPGGEKKT